MRLYKEYLKKKEILYRKFSNTFRKLCIIVRKLSYYNGKLYNIKEIMIIYEEYLE